MSGRSAGFEVYEHFEGTGESRKVVGRTKKFKFIDRQSALALMGKACHWYADRQEEKFRREFRRAFHVP